LWNIPMEDIRRCCGLEAYLFLMFVKKSAQFFFVVMILSNGILLPVYLYGDTNEATLANSAERYTLLNAIGKPMKMWIVFTVTIIIGISGHLFVYFFQTSIANKKTQYEDKHKLSVSENTIRRHTLMISGINTELTAEEVTKSMKDLFPAIAKAADDEKRRLANIKKAAEDKFRQRDLKDQNKSNN